MEEKWFVVAVKETKWAQVAVKATCHDDAYTKAYKKCVDDPEEWEASELEFKIV